jgi:O-antigen/teichoic acid export membrane protein
VGTLSRNVVANFIARASSVAITVLLPPVYARLMGIQSYALITFYTFLSAFLGILDLGFTPTITREVARLFRAPDPDAQGQLRRTILTYERAFLGVGAAGGAAIVLAAPLLATRWLHVSPDLVHRTIVSIVLMGATFAAQWPTSIYQAILYGSEKQVLSNSIVILGSFARAVAALAGLHFFAPSPTVFFASQAIVGLLQTIVLRVVVSRMVITRTAGDSSRSFDPRVLVQNWQFSAGVFLNTILGFLLGQADKMVLSRVLTLEILGYYGLASALAGGLYNVGSSVYVAVFPRFVQLAARRAETELARLYHLASQVIAALILPAAAVALIQPQAVLEAWTGQPKVATIAGPFLGPLALGTSLNILLTTPMAMQLAYNWTSLGVTANAIVALFMLPATYLCAHYWGAVGAARNWAFFNSVYLVTYIPFMHTRILKGELPRWYANLLSQALAAAAPVLALRAWWPYQVDGRLHALRWIAVSGALSLVCTAMATSTLRLQILNRARQLLSPRA